MLLLNRDSNEKAAHNVKLACTGTWNQSTNTYLHK